MRVGPDAVLDEQLLNPDLIAEELPCSSVNIDVRHQRPDERGCEVDVGTRIEHPLHIDGCGHGYEQTMTVAVVLVLLLPQPAGSLLHSPTLGRTI